MRVLVQRVIESRVQVDGHTIADIAQGLNLLVGLTDTDTEVELDWMAQKCLNLRLFPQGEDDRWDASVQEIGGEILVVSQFTLYGNCRKGRRPSFDKAAPPPVAEPLFEQFVDKLRVSGLKVVTGQFGANMRVDIQNNGPVTFLLEREAPNTLKA
ncbi:D-aminoacyl-tRNA deacylase [Oscillatoria sp. CS-180]|uniref:D-aminoacyl-tRNA deacylase n=1 Tax=Oscillatoria sp. CS-180 TaxID=3021720 RepID=UPI00232BDB2F|nr:D-aminoacyl-tRNA deacylase [Oscillatoria sp. CS-180]MDB9527998.1 D-aminoacyl-tRNA deacylase [Oscillatoria sp. CS-180]